MLLQNLLDEGYQGYFRVKGQENVYGYLQIDLSTPNDNTDVHCISVEDNTKIKLSLLTIVDINL